MTEAGTRTTTMKIRSFRASDEDYERWSGEAKDEGVSLGQWIRRRLNGPVAPKLASVARVPIATKLVQRKGKCEHRIPPGTYCKTCEKIK